MTTAPADGFRDLSDDGVRGPVHDWHSIDDELLTAFTLPIGDDGIPVGVDPDNRPAIVGLFRRMPMDVTLIAGSHLAGVIGLRAVAAGARVVVETARPALWTPLAQSADGGQQNVTVAPVGRVGALGASLQAPVLVIRDLGARPPRSRPATGPWQATLTLLPYLDPRSAALLANADLVGLQRLSPGEAELAAATLGLSPEETGALPSFGDDLTLWCGTHGRRYAYLVPTAHEVGLLGHPRRIDA